MTASLAVEGVCVDLGGRRVVENASLAVQPREMIGLVGANGSGKTTLIRAALGLIGSATGEARLAGDPARSLTRAALAARVGYLPQERTIGWNLAAWRVAALGAPLRPPPAAREHALEALAKAGAAHLADRRVLDLSGGERAKVLLARLLATRAPLLVADEPIAGLDPDAQLHALDVLRAHADAGGAVLATLHDLTLAARRCHRIVVMAAGRIVATGHPREVFTPAVLERAFGLSGGLIDTAHGPVLAHSRANAPGVPG